MTQYARLIPEFVDAIPEKIERGKIYVSMEFATAVHSCCCGCGMEVVTPFTPTDWKLIFDGVSVSLSPSIGNWSFPCRSHYWIKNNQIQWAGDWSQELVDAGRIQDQLKKHRHFGDAQKTNRPAAPKKHKGLLTRFFSWLK